MHSCAGCGTPTAPSWEYCPKCGAALGGASPPTSALPKDEPLESERPSSAFRAMAWTPSRGHRAVVIAVVLVIVAVSVGLATIDVGLHNESRSAHAALTLARAQVSQSQVSLRVVNARFKQTQALNAEDTAILSSTESALENALQSAAAGLQGAGLEVGTTIVTLPRVQGIGGDVILTRASASRVVVTPLISGTTPGTFAIALGACPEGAATQTFSARALAPDSVILPSVNIYIPANGPRFWVRLSVIITTESGDQFTALGGVLGSFQGSSLVQGAPVPPDTLGC